VILGWSEKWRKRKSMLMGDWFSFGPTFSFIKEKVGEEKRGKLYENNTGAAGRKNCGKQAGVHWPA
jgi:hypothetical protein